MYKFIFVSVLMFGTAQLHAARIHTSSLGWPAGQDVTTQFSALLAGGTISAGDELILDAAYRISGTHQLPDDYTISAVKGAGFDVTDAVSGNGAHFLRMGNRTTLRNLTITYLDTPPLGDAGGTNPARGVDYFERIGIYVSGKDDVHIEYCRLEGSIAHQVRVDGGARFRLTGCCLRGGFWTVYLAGNVTDPVFRNCLIEQCQGDAVKTGRGGTYGIQRALVDNCVFQDNGRDGIDLTGGFKNSTVRKTVFRRLFSGMDIKSIFEFATDLSPDISNTDISIDSCTFTDMANAVTLSTLDRGFADFGEYFLDSASAQEYAPHDIYLNDCIIERTGAGEVRMLLLKGGHSVRYTDAQYRGDGIGTVKYSNVFDTFGPSSLSEEVSDALNHSVSGTLGAAAAARAPGDTSIWFDCGPQDNPLGITDPGMLSGATMPDGARRQPGALFNMSGTRVNSAANLPAGVYLGVDGADVRRILVTE